MTRRRLLIATTNAGKVREIKRFLAGLPFDILSLHEVLPEASFREKEKTFLGNARAKSLYYGRKSGLLTLAEDSGLEVKVLDGAPGIYSARFSRPKPTDEANNRKVLRLLKIVPRKERNAKFVCAMVLSRGGRIIKEIRGQVRGSIAFEPQGTNGFGYDPIFYYAPLKKNFAELSAAEKNTVSHRGRALRTLKAFLERSALSVSKE